MFVDVLDPVDGGELGEDLSLPGMASKEDAPPPPKRVRKRPQLELFRKSR
jgi:hypothetical protein